MLNSDNLIILFFPEFRLCCVKPSIAADSPMFPMCGKFQVCEPRARYIKGI